MYASGIAMIPRQPIFFLQVIAPSTEDKHFTRLRIKKGKYESNRKTATRSPVRRDNYG